MIPKPEPDYLSDIRALFVSDENRLDALVMPRVLLGLLDGDYEATAMLARLIYWADKTRHPDGWIYKSAEDWERELYLTRTKLQRATQRISAYVEVKRFRVAGKAINHYRLNAPALLSAMQGFCNAGFLQCAKPTLRNEITEDENPHGVTQCRFSAMQETDNPIIHNINTNTHDITSMGDAKASPDDWLKPGAWIYYKEQPGQIRKLGRRVEIAVLTLSGTIEVKHTQAKSLSLRESATDREAEFAATNAPIPPHVALIEAWWQAIPDDLRPAGPAPISRNAKLARQMANDPAYTPDGVGEFVRTKHTDFMRWVTAQNAGVPYMSLEYVNRFYKRWVASQNQPKAAPTIIQGLPEDWQHGGNQKPQEHTPADIDRIEAIKARAKQIFGGKR